MRINRILERTSGHRSGKSRHQNNGGDRALQFHGLTTLLSLCAITNELS
jgi:hypothetical protein